MKFGSRRVFIHPDLPNRQRLPYHHRLSKRLEELYAYLFRELVSVRYNRDPKKFRRILQLLEYQRETWHQACGLCEQEENETSAGDPAAAQNLSSSPGAASGTADLPHIAGGLSLEA